MAKKRGELREAVLDAAMALVETSDPAQLTLEAVAAKAGVSKGGLQYYFKSKEALLSAMIARVIETFDKTWRNGGMESSAQEQLLETYLNRSFGVQGGVTQAALALFAVAAHHPKLLQPVQDYFDAHTAEIMEKSNKPYIALILKLAADAIWHYDTVGINRFDAGLRKRLHTAVIDLARQQGVISAPGLPAPSKSKMPRKAKATT